MKDLIIINGTGGSGKDTFVYLCAKYAKVKNFSSIDKVKVIAKQIGWEGSKTEKDRKFLSDLKKLTTDYNDMAFNDMLMNINLFNSSNDDIMFIHIREPEEIARAVEATGAKTLLIKRSGLDNIESNHSDRDVDNYHYDFVVYNDSTMEEFEEKAKIFVNIFNNN